MKEYDSAVVREILPPFSKRSASRSIRINLEVLGCGVSRASLLRLTSLLAYYPTSRGRDGSRTTNKFHILFRDGSSTSLD